MSARPILFSAPMVRALLAGTKTQTRRVLSHQPTAICSDAMWRRQQLSPQMVMPTGFKFLDAAGSAYATLCPYGKTGDLLWVRETFAPVHSGDPLRGARYKADGAHWHPWKPAIHMPRWASRLTLRITDVRVQRLQEISNDDCDSEGIPYSPDVNLAHDYQALWESINGPGSWDANPWVWALTFEVITANLDAVLGTPS